MLEGAPLFRSPPFYPIDGSKVSFPSAAKPSNYGRLTSFSIFLCPFFAPSSLMRFYSVHISGQFLVYSPDPHPHPPPVIWVRPPKAGILCLSLDPELLHGIKSKYHPHILLFEPTSFSPLSPSLLTFSFKRHAFRFAFPFSSNSDRGETMIWSRQIPPPPFPCKLRSPFSSGGSQFFEVPLSLPTTVNAQWVCALPAPYPFVWVTRTSSVPSYRILTATQAREGVRTSFANRSDFVLLDVHRHF